MAELDKFKRRVIRTVARMIRQENRPENEMWALLKKETGCDCKLLWERMRSLTLKKMKRLLLAEDKVDNIIPVARMSLTDWLLFDLVLVHEDIDVIGEELGLKNDMQPLKELLALVQKLQIEGKQGEALAKAWTAATIAYNTDGRQCSPMLLQRRWYQMKKVSRAGFYKFWFSYRGNSRLLENCKNMVPSKLKMEVAQQYPHIVTKPFLEWEELIKQKFVILPHEIEKNMKAKAQPVTPSNNETTEADIVLLEPSIETIDLSDAEPEPANSDADTPEETTDTQLPTDVVVKTEPIEEPGVYTESLSERLEKRGAKLLESIPNIDDEELNSNVAKDSAVGNSVNEKGDDVEKENVVTEIDESVNIVEDPDVTVIDDSNIDFEENIRFSKIKTENINTEKETGEAENQNTGIESEKTQNDLLKRNEDGQKSPSVEVKSEYVSHDHITLETDNDLISEQMQINDLIVMPQISNVFGNVDAEQLSVDNISRNVETEALSNVVDDASNEPMEVVDSGEDVINEKLKTFLMNNKKAGTKETVRSEENLEADISSIPVVETNFDDIADEPMEVDDGEDAINEKLKTFLENNRKTEAKETISSDINLVLAKEKNAESNAPPIPVVETAFDDINDEPMDDGENAINEKLKMFLENNKKSEIKETLSTDLNLALPKEDTLQKANAISDEPNSLYDFSVDLTFADDGIELDEDDVEFEDDIIKPIKECDIKAEKYSEDSNTGYKEKESEAEENAKFDLKLLMQPVVYTTKLDDMIIFRNTEIHHVADITIIDSALSESKPLSKFSQNIKEEKEETQEIEEFDNNDMITTAEPSNSEENISENESETEELTVARVKLSSYLLQKPRSRSYNPIQLCKNPDFNTRLKRLTFGFLSSTRNRSFLKTLKPMTIDVSKAFESKLVKGTMYLQPDANNPRVDIIEEVTEKTSSVLPSAMPVQSLIDNAVAPNVFPPTSSDAVYTKQSEGKSSFPERNKVINLPDIDHIRKMNQRLYTAEITPMRIQRTNEKCVPPVQLLSSSKEQPPGIKDTIKDPNIFNTEAQLNVRKNIQLEKPKENDTPTPKVVNETRLIDPLPLRTKPGPKSKSMLKKNYGNYSYIPCRGKPETSVAWLSKRTIDIPNDDALLTIDTLNKMLNLMQYSDLKPFNEKCKKSRKLLAQQQLELECRLAAFEHTLKGLNSEDQTSKDQDAVEEDPKNKKKDTKANTSEMKDKENDQNIDSTAEDDKTNKKNSTKEKTSNEKDQIKTQPRRIRTKYDVCCWARHKIENPSTRRRHMCPRLCTCCCRQELVDTRLRLKPAVKENVVVTVGCVSQSQPLDVGTSTVTPMLTLTPSEKLSQAITTPRVTEISTQCNLGDEPVSGVQNKIQLESDEVMPPDVIEIDDNDEPEIVSDDSNKKSVDQSVTCPPTKIVYKRRGRPRLNPVSVPRISVLPTSALVAPDPKPRVPVLKPSHITPTKPIVIKNTAPFYNFNDTDDVKERLIYLNNKQKTNSETGCPIFLGRNKILLTDETIPPSLQSSPLKVTSRHYKTLAPHQVPQILPQVPQVQPQVLQVQPQVPQVQPQVPLAQSEVSQGQPEAGPILTLPEGVQILLMPNGQVTYTIDPSVNHSAEDLATLPAIVAAIQEQLALNSSNQNLQTPQNVGDVVNLVDDETSDEIAKKQATTEDLGNTAKLTNDMQSSVELGSKGNENSTNSLDNASGLISKDNENAISDTSASISNVNVVSTDLEKNENEALKCTEEILHTDKNNDVTSSSNNSLVIDESNPKQVLNSEPATALKPVDETTESTDDANALIATTEDGEKIGTEVDSVTKEGEGVSTEDKDGNSVNATTTSNRSTLLSDLMQMSGISAEDTTPSDNLEVQVPPLIHLPLRSPSIPKTSPRYLQTAINAKPVITTSPSKNVKELNSITSFAQLKYACEQKGNFFKLDLDTGSITSINVCIKKNQVFGTKPITERKSLQNIKPKSVTIDLTDDPPSPDEFDPPAFIISKPTQSLLKDSFHLPNSAKPLKIFKSANILNRKRNNDANPPVADKNLNTAQHKNERKQILDLLTDDNSVDSIDEYIWAPESHSDDSSDDEPLAVKAKRMRTTDSVVSTISDNSQSAEDITQETVDNNMEPSTDIPSVTNNNETSNNEANDQNNDGIADNSEQNAITDEKMDDAEGYTEIQFLSEHEDDDSDDNCILGV